MTIFLNKDNNTMSILSKQASYTMSILSKQASYLNGKYRTNWVWHEYGKFKL